MFCHSSDRVSSLMLKGHIGEGFFKARVGADNGMFWEEKRTEELHHQHYLLPKVLGRLTEQ